MTEYDFSPGAWQAHLAKQAQIDKWRRNNANFQPTNPFLPTSTARDDSDFYKSSKKKKSKKGKSRAHDGDDSDASDYSGPDRPPTPPASAPVGYGGVFPFQMGPMGYPHVQAYQGLSSAPVQPRQSHPPAPGYQFIQNGTPLVPQWTGTCWVYQAPASTSTTHVASSGSSHRSSRKHRRKKSLPTPLPLPMIPAAVPMYGYFQAPQQAGQRGPYSGSVPAMSTSAMYLPSGHTSPASGGYTTLPQSAGVYPMQMPVPQIHGQSAGGYTVKPSNASASSYPYGTIIVDGKRDSQRSSSGSSFFGRLRKKK
ncbi:hypothetical protein CC1G_10367 [Coprinopsis cinerea okayama7|uniref:Uncharacterized protein n=1 Tax=Coprinopsis cinerea (strain Okayama-7 / 130 / ATCC MYA-4618 / FGSC 9003) TaxID=240176 RepID=A8PEA0_COPC7|nr:hypothetical protein CC1G_10367 [Coprinopsis cinerea okayama7\|eukprot:XP_001840753.2 hypothetical protein CC1G_10367 [Coprinopsis cinerea okayama7\